MKSRPTMLFFFLLTLVSASLAQSFFSNPSTPSKVQLSSDLKFHLHVQEVSLVLTVTDHHGHFVRNLTPSDLTILDNNTPQNALTFFQSETDLPMDVALVVDMSASVSYRFPAEQSTVAGFVKKISRPVDSVMLFAFNQRLEFMAPIQNNWKQVSKRIKKLKPDGDTAIYDAVGMASEWLGQDTRPARHVMILITDGEENASKSTLNDAIAQALKAGTTIYSVNVGDDQITKEGKQGQQVLKDLSSATGGTYMIASPTGDVTHAFKKIQRELRSQYALAYRPSNLVGEIFHHITILPRGNLRVHCRSGYYAKSTY